jgi:hypothetical protein
MRTEEETERAPTNAADPRRSRRRRVAVVVIVVVIGMIVVGGFITMLVGLGVRGDLEQGRADLISGRDALVDGRLDDAIADFQDARRRFDVARARTASWPAAITRRIPVVGRTMDVMAGLADAASVSAATGVEIAAGIQQLPGGIEGLIGPDGSISLPDAARAGQLLATAEEDIARALGTVRSSPSTWVPGPVARARTDAIEELEGSRRLIGTARVLADTLPAFAGASGPRRYLFFAENPAELRGTGGLWGAFSMVQARDGRFRVSRFRPTQTLPILPPERVPVPFPEYRENYGQYGAPGYWLNVNMTPDFPSAARAALSAWEATGRPSLDGVITADPFALRELLVVTGPIDAPIPGITLTADDVVPFLTNRAFARFSDPVQRKVVLGEASRAVVERFLALDGRALARLQALGRALSAGHLKVYASDPSTQAAFARVDVDSSVQTDRGDVVAVIVNAGAGGKIDFFSKRTIQHDVELVPGGDVIATTSVTIENGAPTSGQPRYVIGPHVGEAGDNIPLISVFCGPGCRLRRAERDGNAVELGSGSELGLRFFRDYFTIPSGQERTLALTTEVPGGWQESGSDGTYRLVFVGQTTIRPTQVMVRVRAPAGMRFTSGSDGVELDGDVATWGGVLGNGLELELSLEEEPLLVRLWRTVMGLG